MNSVGRGRKGRRGSHGLGCTWRCRLLSGLSDLPDAAWGKGGLVGRMLIEVKASPSPHLPPLGDPQQPLSSWYPQDGWEPLLVTAAHWLVG